MCRVWSVLSRRSPSSDVIVSRRGGVSNGATGEASVLKTLTAAASVPSLATMAELEQIDGNGPAAAVPPADENGDDGSPPANRLPTLRDASPDPEPQKDGPAPFSLPKVSFFGTPAPVAPKENPSMTQSFQAKNLPMMHASTTKSEHGDKKNIFVIGACTSIRPACNSRRSSLCLQPLFVASLD